VRRHAARHLPTTLVLAAEAGEVMRADDLLGEARRLHRETLEALEAAKASGHLGATLQAIDRAQRSVALLAGLFDRLQKVIRSLRGRPAIRSPDGGTSRCGWRCDGREP